MQVDAEVVRVSDTDSARQAAGQARARHAHDARLSEVLRAGSGIRSAPTRVTDTDSARAAAGQNNREQQLLADYADYVTMQEHAVLDAGGTSSRQLGVGGDMLHTLDGTVPGALTCTAICRTFSSKDRHAHDTP